MLRLGPSTAQTKTRGRTLLNRWNGLTWATQPLPHNAQQGELSGVSCPSLTYCVAVGDLGLSGNKPAAVLLSRS